MVNTRVFMNNQNDPKIIFPFTVNSKRNVTMFKENTTWGYSDGQKDYIDLSLGSCGCCPIGFKRTDFNNQSDKFAFLSGDFQTTNEHVVKLSDRFYEFTGCRSIFSLSGSDAVETAIKVARLTNNKQVVLGFENSYHGSTYMSSSASGSQYLHERFGREANCKTVSWNIGELANTIATTENISCLIVETCSWQNGLYEQSIEWWRSVRKLCADNNIIFIIDDVAFSGSKTGKFFGYHLELKPDLVCFGKAVSGGYYPLSGVLVADNVYDVIKDIPFLHGFSYSFSMSGILSALHYLDVIEQEKINEKFLECQQASRTLIESLPNVKAHRNFGLMWCLDLSTPITDHQLFLDNGLYIGLWNADPNKLLIQFPSIIDDQYYQQLKERLTNVLVSL